MGGISDAAMWGMCVWAYGTCLGILWHSMECSAWPCVDQRSAGDMALCEVHEVPIAAIPFLPALGGGSDGLSGAEA